MSKLLQKTATRLGIFLLALLIGACQNDTSESMPGSQENGPPPAMPVTTAEVVAKTIELWETFTGRLESAERVELRPRVSGYLKDVAFTEGAFVNSGDLLFTIDDAPFKAEVRRLEAELNSARAQIALATRDVERASSLKQTNAISQEQLDNRNTQLIKARADADAIEAALENAKLNLSYTQVVAPISGRISNANITQGNYVTQGDTVLTSIVSIKEIHAYFDVDENTFIRLTERRLLKGDKQLGAVAQLQLAGSSEFTHTGKIDFIDNQINPLTGTIRLRASFANTDDRLTPGMFARIRMQVGAPVEAILIDEQVISTDLSNKYVLRVGDQNMLEYQPVSLGVRQGHLRVINAGLNKGDQIVVKGLHMVRPGMPVVPEKIDMLSLRAPVDAQ